MKSDQTIADALGIEHVEVEEVVESKELTSVDPPALPVNQENTDIKEDYELARKTYKNMIEKGEDAIEHMTRIAKDSESARTYEVLAVLLKTTSEITRDMFDLQRSLKEIRGGPQRQADTINVEKAVFVGTTDDLLQQVNANKERK